MATKKKNPCKNPRRKRKNYVRLGNPQMKKIENMISSLQKAVTANPKYHFPKTKRGRKQVMRTWVISSPGKPPLRFQATKTTAMQKARKLVSSGQRKKVVLDGPK